MAQTLSQPESRRIFLHAQGLSRRRPAGAVTERHFGEYLARQGVLQLDTVNVLARAHYLPAFSRYGAYDTARLDAYLWGDHDGHSAHCFEHWGHEASVMPLDMLPLLQHRMAAADNWKARTHARLERDRPGLLAQVRAAVEASGPLVGADLDHLAPRGTSRGGWWDLGDVKVALEYLFFTGQVAASRGRHFARTYDATQRAWGGPPADAGGWGVPDADARQALFDRALAACGVGTPADLCDHFRLKPAARPGNAGAAAWAASAVERGLAQWVTVEGWRGPALLAAGAQDPGRATGAALLSPFDPVCWYRPRLERVFGMDYRIEIYTPEPKRRYGYYTLPFLLGDQMVGRFDLKADRKAGELLVQAAWREAQAAPGARRRGSDDISAAAATELRLMATWLGLHSVVAKPRGNLADALAAALS